MLLTEVITVEPYQFKAGTQERGSAWTKIAERLASCGLKVTQRSVPEKFEKLMKDLLKKESKEKKQSGVDVEYGELDQSLQDIKERMAEFDELREGKEQKKKKEKAAAEEMRRQATETRKRKASLDDPDVDKKIPKGKRNKSTSMVDVVKETIELQIGNKNAMKEYRRGSWISELQRCNNNKCTNKLFCSNSTNSNNNNNRH